MSSLLLPRRSSICRYLGPASQPWSSAPPTSSVATSEGRRRLVYTTAGKTVNSELCFQTATELTRRIRAREVSVTEVIQAHLAQIERVNPKVNAIITLTAERALDEARAKDTALARGEARGPLFGLPGSSHDLAAPLRVRTTHGISGQS